MPKQKNRGDHPPFMSSLKVFFDWLRWSCDAWWPPHERSRQLLNRRLLPSLVRFSTHKVEFPFYFFF
jgi:hypothetical protein